MSRAYRAVPTAQASIVAQIGQTVAAGNPLFYLVQISAAVVLALAANTSFNGFPLLAAIMARDSFLPQWQQLLHNQTALTLELMLRTDPRVVVTTVPVRLER